MAIFQVPVNPTLAKQIATITLDDIGIQYRLRWNSRVPGPGDGGGFYLDISTPEGERIISGVRLVPWWPLAGRIPDDRIPFNILTDRGQSGGDQQIEREAPLQRGGMFLVDREGGGLTDAYPELDAFEERFSLIYCDNEGLVDLGVPEQGGDGGDGG